MHLFRTGTFCLLLASPAACLAVDNFVVKLTEVGDKNKDKVEKLASDKAGKTGEALKKFLDGLPGVVGDHLSKADAEKLEKEFAALGAKVENKAWTNDTGDTAWMLVSTALVLLMTLPGLALFYGGLVRAKNLLSVMMQCMAVAVLVSVQWWLCGYSFSFGKGDWLGGVGKDAATHYMLKGVSADDSDPYGYAGTIPHQLWMAYQLMFAIITPALICGAFAERVKFLGMCVLLALWSTIAVRPSPKSC